MSNPPPATLQAAMKQGTDDVKVQAAQLFGAVAGRVVQAKGIDMMMNPNKDVMSVPDSVKAAGGLGADGLKGTLAGMAKFGNDAFKKLLSGGTPHNGDPSHGLHTHAAPAPEQGKVR